MSEHPRVEAFLRSFDAASARLPIARRRALRAEIAAHLHEAVPREATDDEARLALLEFGTPEEIVAQEGVNAPVRRVPRGVLAAIAAAAAVAVVVVVVITRPSAPSVGEPADPAAYDSVVSARPNGAERETEGEAFRAYAYEASQLPALPPGAEWPAGVQVGLNAGLVPDGSGVMEGGGGVWQARFTWICAWEGEYLNAVSVKDNARKAVAFEALEYWAEADFMAEVDPTLGWATSVLGEVKADYDNLRALKIDFTDRCMQAGILGVQYSY